MEASVGFVVETGGWKWVELGGRSTIVHTCRKTNGWNLTSKPPILQLLKDRNIIWTKKNKNPPFFFWFNMSGQILATSHDLTPNGGLVREIPLFQGNLGWWNIIIWPDMWTFQGFTYMPSWQVNKQRPRPRVSASASARPRVGHRRFQRIIWRRWKRCMSWEP